jgi:hypothetical protein
MQQAKLYKIYLINAREGHMDKLYARLRRDFSRSSDFKVLSKTDYKFPKGLPDGIVVQTTHRDLLDVYGFAAKRTDQYVNVERINSTELAGCFIPAKLDF